MLWYVWSSPRREYMLGVSQILMNYRLQDLSHDSLLINCINTKQFLFAFLQKLSGPSLFGALSDHASHPADVTSNVTICLNRVISATAYFGTMEQTFFIFFFFIFKNKQVHYWTHLVCSVKAASGSLCCTLRPTAHTEQMCQHAG